MRVELAQAKQDKEKLKERLRQLQGEAVVFTSEEDDEEEEESEEESDEED